MIGTDLEKGEMKMKLHVVLVEPEIPQNTRKYCKNLCSPWS